MTMSRPFGLIILAWTAATLSAGAAHAAPEEIQVYMDEMNRPGHFGLDVHVNYTADGRLAETYPGEQASDRRWRITPEFSYGLTPSLDLGLYLPLTTIDREGRFDVGGVKGRLKYIAPKAPGQSWFWGANFELGKVKRQLDINPWNAELKGIWGVRKGPWTLAANGNIGWMVSGPDHTPTTFELATKVSYQLRENLAFGLESYNDLGTARRFGRLHESDQRLYLVMDKSFGRWDLGLGLGYGYGQPEDHLVIKAIVGVPIQD